MNEKYIPFDATKAENADAHSFDQVLASFDKRMEILLAQELSNLDSITVPTFETIETRFNHESAKDDPDSLPSQDNLLRWIKKEKLTKQQIFKLILLTMRKQKDCDNKRIELKTRIANQEDDTYEGVKAYGKLREEFYAADEGLSTNTRRALMEACLVYLSLISQETRQTVFVDGHLSELLFWMALSKHQIIDTGYSAMTDNSMWVGYHLSRVAADCQSEDVQYLMSSRDLTQFFLEDRSTWSYLKFIRCFPAQAEIALANLAENDKHRLFGILVMATNSEDYHKLPINWEMIGGCYSSTSSLLAPLGLNRNFHSCLTEPLAARLSSIDSEANQAPVSNRENIRWKSIDEELRSFFALVKKHTVIPRQSNLYSLLDTIFVAIKLPTEIQHYRSSTRTMYSHLIEPATQNSIIYDLFNNLLTYWPEAVAPFLRYRVSDRQITGIDFNYQAYVASRDRARVTAAVTLEASTRLAEQPIVTDDEIRNRLNILLGDEPSEVEATFDPSKLKFNYDQEYFERYGKPDPILDGMVDYVDKSELPEARWDVEARVAQRMGINFNPRSLSRLSYTYRHDGLRKRDLSSLHPELATNVLITNQEISAVVRLMDVSDFFSYITGIEGFMNLDASFRTLTIRSVFDSAINGYQRYRQDPRFTYLHEDCDAAINFLRKFLPLITEDNMAAIFYSYRDSDTSELAIRYRAFEARVKNLCEDSTDEESRRYVTTARWIPFTIMTNVYLENFIPRGDQCDIVQALPPALIDRSGVTRSHTNFDNALSNLPPDLIPITFEDLEDTTLTGPNGSGKSLCVDAIAANLAAAAARNEWYFPIAREVRLPIGKTRVIRLTSPLSTESQSLFQASGKVLADLVRQLFDFYCIETAFSRTRRSDDQPNEPVLIVVITDEWGIGTDPLARTAILKATQRYFAKLLPSHIKIVFLNSTHEGLDHMLADHILDRRLGSTKHRKRSVMAFDSVTRRQVVGKIAPSLASVALRAIDPETAAKAALIEELMDADIDELELSGVPERPIPEGTFDGCASLTDLNRLGFLPTYDKGQFSFLFSCLKNLGMNQQQAIGFTHSFARAFISSAETNQQRERIEELKEISSKVSSMSIDDFRKILRSLTDNQKELDMFSADKISLSEGITLVSSLEKIDTTISAIKESVSAVLPDKAKLQLDEALEIIRSKARELAKTISQLIIEEAIRRLVNLVLDHQLLRQQLDADDQELSKLCGSREPIVSEGQVVEALISLAKSGQADKFLAIVQSLPSRDKIVWQELGCLNDGRVDEKQLGNNQLFRILTASGDASTKLTNLKSQIGSTSFNFLDGNDRFSIINNLPGELENALSLVNKSTQQAVLAVGRRILLEENTLGVKWSEAGRSSKGISFSQAYDLAVRFAIGGDKYLPQNFDTSDSSKPDSDVHVFTGPNAEGKTSVAKVAAELVVWANVLDIGPAEKFDVGELTSVSISLNGFVPNPSLGLSGLTAQGADIVRIVDFTRNKKGKGIGRTLTVLDEIWAGTSCDGQRDLTTVTLEQLVDANALIMATSHDATLSVAMQRINKGRNSVGKLPCQLTEHTVDGHRVQYDRRGQSLPYNIMKKEMAACGVNPAVISDVELLAQAVEADLRVVHDLAAGEELNQQKVETVLEQNPDKSLTDNNKNQAPTKKQRSRFDLSKLFGRDK